MKRILWIIALVGLLALAACGPEAVVEKAAAEMNLDVEDLPAGFRQQGEDLGLADILERVNLTEGDQGAGKDGNMRTFVLTPDITATAELTDTAAVTTTQVVAAILRFDSEGAAQGGADEIAKGFEHAFKTVSLKPEVLAAPQVGTAAQFQRVEVSAQKAQAYLLVFHKKNVVGMVLVTGPGGTVEELVRSLGPALDKKIPLPVTPSS